MPGPTLMTPTSVDNNSNAATDDTDTVPARKKGLLGRIKSRLVKNFGLQKQAAVASPTPKDLIKAEPEIPDQQQIEQEENNTDKEDLSPEQHQSQNDEVKVKGPSRDDQLISVLQFDESVPALKSVTNELETDSTISVMQCLEEYNQKCIETSEQIEEDNVDEEDEQDKTETTASHETEETGDIPEELLTETPEENEDDTLEVFDNGEGNQQLEASSCVPEDGDEEDKCHDEAFDSYPMDPSGTLQNVDLMIIGVTPPALQNHTPCDDVCEEEEEPLDTELATPRVNEPLSSPMKRVRPGPGVDMMSSIASQGSTLPHPPLHEIREEDDNSDHPPLRSFGGRRHLLFETPILSSSSAPYSPQVDEPSASTFEEEPRVEQQVHEDVEPESKTVDTGALITHAFGERIVNLLAADPWGDRQDGFDAIKLAVKQANVSTADPVTRQRLLCASLAAAQCGVEDRVAPVMYCALECFRAILKEFARVLPDERVDTESKSVAVLNTQLSTLVGALVKKLGDSNKRTQREATQALVRIARLRSLRALPHLLLHLSGREVPPRRKLETLRRLMQEFGLTTAADSSSQQKLTVESVLEFVAPSLKIAEEKTRKVAVEILADLQTRTGNSTDWQAQLARAGAVKPEMLRVITRRVDELVTKREQQQAAIAEEAVTGSAAINQAEEHVDDEAAFPPAELVDVPQEDAQSSIKLLETSLLNAQNIVGPVCWRKLSSKTWSDRKEALLDVEKAMIEAKSDLRDTRPTFGSSTQSTFVAYSALLHRALGDSIAPVLNTALDAYATLVKIYGPRIEWRGADVRDVTLLTLLRLLAAMQKPNTRTTRAACRGVLKLARLPNARHPLRYVLSCVFNGEGNSACDPQVQMHLLRLLVPEFGFQADGLGASRVLDAVSKGLTHSSARVRRSAADVALSAQRLLGREFVLARLQDVKPVTLKELEKSFVDGVGSGGAERPQTVHATAVEVSAPVAIGGSGLPPVTFGGPGEFASRRLLHSAPVGIGRLQFTPHNEELSASSQARASVLSNEEENLMDSILGGNDF
ncbi:hypothetical protein PPTG_02407 [Phytophthora nicotianae INRA-310]|uniref:TOG domain-containing protein n=1 Tax=Phytophthora nicotianae (strain INRA-310) TaxID=761204 RepID=W2RAS8_PHYN3|nr:hypothetical protein PPTG_02407 [Phytophthora nicotianae INRA-310]ETN22482.1 hypothetical protein PPTG_02407 [Phytophthora nicotianae INRA-310]